MEIEIVVADRHTVVRDGLRFLLAQHGIRVVGTAASLADARTLIAIHSPRVAVLDAVLAEEAALATGLLPGVEVPMVVYVANGASRALKGLLARRAVGLVLKQSPIDDLARAVHVVASGRRFVDPAAVAGVRSNAGGSASLTQRQAEVLEALARGLAVEQIAAQLVLSPATVYKHVQNAVARLGARGRLHAVALAARQGEISLDPNDA